MASAKICQDGEFETTFLFEVNSAFGQSPEDAPLGGTAVRQGETIFNMAHSMYKSSKTTLILSSRVISCHLLLSLLGLCSE
eukprot:s94_g55.t1